jgi:hypothetical protein
MLRKEISRLLPSHLDYRLAEPSDLCGDEVGQHDCFCVGRFPRSRGSTSKRIVPHSRFHTPMTAPGRCCWMLLKGDEGGAKFGGDPSMRNWIAMVVLPTPGSPSNKNTLSLESPPERTSSRPEIPVRALSISLTITVPLPDDPVPGWQAQDCTIGGLRVGANCGFRRLHSAPANRQGVNVGLVLALPGSNCDDSQARAAGSQQSSRLHIRHTSATRLLA